MVLTVRGSGFWKMDLYDGYIVTGTKSVHYDKSGRIDKELFKRELFGELEKVIDGMKEVKEDGE